MGKTILLMILTLCLLTPKGAALAEETEVNGLIIDQTHTRIGQDFSREFCTLWGDPQVDFRYNIGIKEIPDARWGSLIIVTVNGQEAYRNTLRPRSGLTEEEARKATAQVKSYLVYLIRTNGNHDTEDLKGNGY